MDDCPDGGPLADDGSGKPVGLFVLKTPKGEEKFLLQDSSFWEYYGYTIVPLSSESKPIFSQSKQVFIDHCASH